MEESDFDEFDIELEKFDDLIDLIERNSRYDSRKIYILESLLSNYDEPLYLGRGTFAISFMIKIEDEPHVIKFMGEEPISFYKELWNKISYEDKKFFASIVHFNRHFIVQEYCKKIKYKTLYNDTEKNYIRIAKKYGILESMNRDIFDDKRMYANIGKNLLGEIKIFDMLAKKR
jgi:hypothetical protein